ncbi:MAG: DotU family type IV/VI secretion system protein [Acidobacteriia bacterium]|nr:DotU family type IV/VI secretion system protein [Terriglobia bacterium]
MTPQTPTAGHSTEQRRENLALVFQEVLTATVRLRAGSQAITDLEQFRAQVRAALKLARQDGANRGYPSEYVQLATFAVVAFLDESVLNSNNPIFVDWPRKPLQEELFGVHVAGEIFFKNLDRLLVAPESEDLADVLEVHHLCILLGFRGRYRMGGEGELRAVTQSVAEKIRRIRGGEAGLLSGWMPVAEPPVRAVDPWVRRLLWSAAICCGLVLVLLIVYKVSLSSGVSDLLPFSDRAVV